MRSIDQQFSIHLILSPSPFSNPRRLKIQFNSIICRTVPSSATTLTQPLNGRLGLLASRRVYTGLIMLVIIIKYLQNLVLVLGYLRK